MKTATKSLLRPWKYPENISMLIINVQKGFIPWLGELLIPSLLPYRGQRRGTLKAALWNCAHTPRAPQQQCPGQGHKMGRADMGSSASFPEGQQVWNHLRQLTHVNSHLSNGESTATKYILKFMLMFFFQAENFSSLSVHFTNFLKFKRLFSVLKT